MKKKILVFGATGAQGGGVARELLRRGKFDVRAITRNASSPAAQALRELGAEIVEGNLDDRASIDAAMQGVYGVFGVTNFWEHFEKEGEHGRTLVEAVAAAKVEHFVLSSLQSIREETNGALNSPHFDLKAEHEALTRKLGIPATFVHVAFYYENFLAFFPPRATGDGTYQFGFPQGDTPLGAVSVEDVGLIVAPIFEQPEKYIGQVLKVVGDEMPATGYADAMGRATGLDVRYAHIPREVFAGFGFPGAADLADMFEFYRVHMPRRTEEIAQGRVIAPGMQSFETWIAKNGAKLKATLTAAA